MSKLSPDAYDAVIIGAGIGGLVCGCYLAKAGMKVLICEQHHKPGGYCTSFKRKGFTFDAAAHAFGGYREGGIVRRVLKDIGADKNLKVNRYNPTDAVETPDFRFHYWVDLKRTVAELSALFPREGNNVERFFSFVLNPDPHSFSKIRSWTFKDVLDMFFSEERLKFLLAAPLLGLGGLPPSMMSAFIGAKLFSEFLLDGGYHPVGGMQSLPLALAERFRAMGGELQLSTLVKRIKVNSGKVAGVVLEKGHNISSRYVISNCDARQTYLRLLGRKNLTEEFYTSLNRMIPSISNFIMYLGLDRYFDGLPNPGTTLCYFPHYDFDRSCNAIKRNDIEEYGGFMLYVSKDMPTILAIVPASYRTRAYWKNNKERFLDSMIDHIERHSISTLSKHIQFKDAATPQTLNRYTLNYRGASFGWAGTPSQLAVPDFKRPSFVQGLYQTGHWSTQGLGISGVVYIGHDVSKMVLRKEKSAYGAN